MGAYLVRRFLLMVLTLFGMSVLIFVMLRLVPGNIADILFDSAGSEPGGEDQDRARARHRPADRRAVRQLDRRPGARRSGLRLRLGAAGDRGDRAAHPDQRQARRLALLFSVLFGVPFGVISAVRQNTPLDYFLRVLSLSGLSLPSFWLGLLVLMACVHWFGAIPIYEATRTASWQERGHARPAGRCRWASAARR